MDHMVPIIEVEDTKTKTFLPFEKEKWSSIFSNTFINTIPSAAHIVGVSATTSAIAERVLCTMGPYFPAGQEKSSGTSIKAYLGYDVGLWVSSEKFIFAWSFGLEEEQKIAQSFHGSKSDDWIVVTYKNLLWDEFSRIYNPVIIKINHFAQLQKNWDSYEGIPPKDETMRRTIDVLFYLYKELANEGKQMPIPFVAPCSDGGIQFEWEKENKEVELVVPHNIEDLMRMIWCEGEDIYEDEKVSPVDVVDKLLWIMKD